MGLDAQLHWYRWLIAPLVEHCDWLMRSNQHFDRVDLMKCSHWLELYNFRQQNRPFLAPNQFEACRRYAHRCAMTMAMACVLQGPAVAVLVALTATTK